MRLVIGTNTPLMSGLFNFNNSYAALPERFYARVTPEPVAAPKAVRVNRSLADALGLDWERVCHTDFASVLTGNVVPEGAEPIAQAYAGHQFGHFVASLGDGRAILLGEHICPNGTRWDIQLKGSGRTPFSRRGDGRAALGPMIREYIIGEALFALGIPTTRSLGFATTGEEVYRDKALPGAVLMRVARSHIRVGTFEYFASRDDREALAVLADYVIDRHYPEFSNVENRYEYVCRKFIERQAELVARWMGVGFIHGVLNTDNVALSGESIDFGPCAFMDSYDPDTVFSSIDTGGRYAYGAQPGVTQWNCARLLEALLPLLHAEQGIALEKARAIISSFPEIFRTHWSQVMRAKLGLLSDEGQLDIELVQELLEGMRDCELDFTNTFRALSFDVVRDQGVLQHERMQRWYDLWKKRIEAGRNGCDPVASFESMRRANPAYIPRNHRVEEAIVAAVERSDLAPLDALQEVLKTPYVEQACAAGFEAPAPPSYVGYRTFCGT
jgi:uncharacterized protein YdiU (UPF0061 family)